MNLYRVYLKGMLGLGFVDYVFRASEAWLTKAKLPHIKFDAGYSMQGILIAQYGYYKCPTCTRATSEPNQHLNDITSDCFAETMRRVNIQPLQEPEFYRLDSRDLVALPDPRMWKQYSG